MPEKYQDEIEEILKGIEEQEPPRPARRPQPIIDDMPRAANEETPSYRDQPRSGGAANSRWKHVTPGRVALAGFIFLVLGLALNSLGFGWLVWLGLVSLAGAYLLFSSAPGRSTGARAGAAAPSNPRDRHRGKDSSVG